MTLSNHNNQLNYLSPIDAAHYIGFSASSLAKKRMDGTGPTYVKLGKRKVVYQKTALDEWLARKVHNNTGEY